MGSEADGGPAARGGEPATPPAAGGEPATPPAAGGEPAAPPARNDKAAGPPTRRQVWDCLPPLRRFQFARGIGVAVEDLRDLPDHLLPAWLRPTPGEQRLPIVIAVAVAITLQWLLPAKLALTPRWLLPGLEILLVIGLTVLNPVRLTREHPAGRTASLLLVASVTAANGVSAGMLAYRLVHGTATEDPGVLIATGGAIYVTNVIAFGLWYWEFDRGGPFARAAARKPYPDFLFPQMSDPSNADPNWEPLFLDYLYVSFTNTVAFSPTDTMPLSRWAKALMTVQSMVAIVMIALVLARAVNILR